MVAKVNVETKSGKFATALLNGEVLTEKQVASRFGIKNVSATVSDLRLNYGIPVYGNVGKNSEGKSVTRYRVGAPTKRVISAGYRALAAAKKLGLEI